MIIDFLKRPIPVPLQPNYVPTLFAMNRPWLRNINDVVTIANIFRRFEYHPQFS